MISLSIGGLGAALRFSPEHSGFAIPRAWQPFLVSSLPADALRVDIRSLAGAPALDHLSLITESHNDLGAARLYSDGNRYVVSLSTGPGAPARLMAFDPHTAETTVWLDPAERSTAFLLDSMLHIRFAQYALLRDAFILHASAIIADGQAWLFMGRSGTGKSTHSQMWMQAFPDVQLLNDDNPLIRILPDGAVMAYGTPWSGKTPCWRNAQAPVAAFVRLQQAPENRLTRLEGIQAFTAILPGVSVIGHSRTLRDAADSAIARVASAIPVATLRCLPTPAAALACRAIHKA